MDFSLSKLRDMLPSLPQLSPTSSDMSDPRNPLDKHFNLPASPTQENDHDEHKSYQDDTDAPSVLDPQPIDESKPKTNLDLINECDSFPYFHSQPQLYLNRINTYYHLRCVPYPDTTLGYILPSVAQILHGTPGWVIDDDERTLTLTSGTTEPERSAIVAATTSAMRATGYFSVLKGWRSELYPVYGPGPKKELLFSIERSASPLFGVVSYGVHMTAYTHVTDESTGERELKLWIPRRAATKQTYGGMLDNTVAGGMATGETPLLCVVREASEEASLPEDLVKKGAKAAGTVSYFHIRDRRAGGETGLLQPEVQFVYDLELPEDVVPKPSDGEVEQFYLWSVDECKERLAKGEFKPNCSVVLLDFFVRWGLLTAEEGGPGGDYVSVVSRLHRLMEFPTM